MLLSLHIEMRLEALLQMLIQQLWGEVHARRVPWCHVNSEISPK